MATKRNDKISCVELDTMNLDRNCYLQQYCQDNDVDVEVVQEVGPGGCWPVVKYTGTFEELCQMIQMFWQDLDLCENIEILED